MRLVLTLVVLSLLAVPASALAPELDLPPVAPAQPSRHLVGFHAMPDLEPGDTYQGERVVEVVPQLRFAVIETADVVSFEARASLDGNVRYVERDDPNFGRALLVPNDVRYGDAGHWGSKKIGAETAWDRTLGSTSVKVAVIDSGLRKTHEEFAGQSRVLQGRDTISEDNDPQDNCGHGTHVAGTIGATINNGKGIAGMAQVSIIPIRALTNSLIALCSGSTTDLAQGLTYAADQGAHFSSNSWGGGSATAITDAINYAHGKGVVQIAAAGNDGGCTNCVSEPWKANAAKVIIVSSTTSSDSFSSFSSEGPEVDVSAPGSSILSSYNGGDTSYSTLSGTSMATPHVTGTAALIKTLNPAFTYADIDSRLKSTAVDLGAAGFDQKFGHGRISAAASVTGGATPPPPTNAAPTACFAASTSGLTASVDGACSSDSDGTIASWSWSWGDGSAASTGRTASHSYATGGTYTVTLTVTDDDGATAATSKSVTVSSPTDPDPGATTLSNGVALSATSGGAGSEQFYKIQVPSGKAQLQVVLDGPACGLLGCSVDMDLYTKRGARATDTSYDCRPYQSGSDETCTHASPAADWWYIRIDVYSGSNGSYTIKATYS